MVVPTVLMDINVSVHGKHGPDVSAISMIVFAGCRIAAIVPSGFGIEGCENPSGMLGLMDGTDAPSTNGVLTVE
jgi:hypothetical protein